MTLKMKLTALIASFTLVIGLMLMGVFAVNQATVNMGGSINFTATDVYARVTGKIENAQGEYADKELPTIEFSAENGTPDQSEWSGLNLLFDDDATPIVITVTVENLAKDRKLTASLTDNTATNENLVKDLKQDGVTYTSGTTKDLDASTGEGTSTTTYVVTFSIADRNKSLPQMDFDLDISLYDESETPEEPEYEILEGFTFDDNGTLISYTGTDTEVVIPSSYSIIEGEPVDKTLEFASLEDFEADAMANMNAYMSMTNFTVMVDGSQYGPYDTFEQFMSEDGNAITAMESATSIIFKYQEGGEKYVEGNDYQVTAIGYGAFMMNTNITKINLPSSLTSIEESAFQYCSGLTSIDLSNCTSLTSIGIYAFSGCSGLTEVDLSNCTSLTSIGDYAFSGCSGLTGITLPSSLTSIESYAFKSCSKLTSIDLSQCTSLTSIESYAFKSCSKLTSIDLSQCTSLTSIGMSVFSSCTGLAEVDLSNCTSLTSIGRHAFVSCANLRSITFPYTTGWYCTTSSTATSGTDLDMSDPEQNATWLTAENGEDYYGYYFKRNAQVYKYQDINTLSH